MLVVKNGGPRLNLGVEDVGIVNAHEDLEVGLQADFRERVHDRALRERVKSKNKSKESRGGNKLMNV